MNPIIRIFHGSARRGGPARALFTVLGLGFFLSAFALIVWLSIRTDSMLGLPRLLPPWAGLTAALALGAPGALLALWCVALFIHSRGTPVPLNPPKVLVTTGPYALSRNPMITGWMLLMYALALALGSMSMALFYLPLVAALGILEVCLVEEPELEMRFGDAYRQYMERTPMFIPWPREKG